MQLGGGADLPGQCLQGLLQGFLHGVVGPGPRLPFTRGKPSLELDQLQTLGGIGRPHGRDAENTFLVEDRPHLRHVEGSDLVRPAGPHRVDEAAAH